MKKLRVTVDGVAYDVEVEILEDDDTGGLPYGFPSGPGYNAAPMPANVPMTLPYSPPLPAAAPKQQGANDKELHSPIAGTVVELKVAPGATVEINQPLIVVEAMKMNTNISSPVAAKVKDIKVKAGDTVQQDQLLLTFE